MPKITKRVVDALRPDRGGKEFFLWDAGDGALKGFGIRMKPSGAASYLVQYRNKEGRTRRLVIGKVGTLTPDEARTLASDALKAAAKGGDLPPTATPCAVPSRFPIYATCTLRTPRATSRRPPWPWTGAGSKRTSSRSLAV